MFPVTQLIEQPPVGQGMPPLAPWFSVAAMFWAESLDEIKKELNKANSKMIFICITRPVILLNIVVLLFIKKV